MLPPQIIFTDVTLRKIENSKTRKLIRTAYFYLEGMVRDGDMERDRFIVSDRMHRERRGSKSEIEEEGKKMGRHGQK